MSEAQSRLKFLVRPINEEAVGCSSYVGMEHVESWTGRYFPVENVDAAARAFRAGDVMFGKLRPYLAKAFVPSSAGCCSPEMLVLRPMPQIEPRFLGYVVLEQGFVRAVDSSTFGAKMPRANWDFIGNLEIPTPTLPKQKAVANFLDHKTAAIDALIEKKQSLLDLLAEKRSALINRAVTKGLDPNVPMKDSGIPWIGEIPAHWRISRVKHELTNLNFRRVPLSTTERSARQGEYPYYGASGIIDYVDDYLFDETTILLAEDGANLVHRNLPLALVATGRYWVNNHAHILRPRDAVSFWAPLLESLDFRPFITGSAQPKLTAEALGNVYVAVPPKAERTAIAEYVRGVETTTDGPMLALQGQIKRLREYRQALITAAVTGQVDISEADDEEAA